MEDAPVYDISHIPNEIVALITTFLSKSDIRNARLASHRLHRLSKVAFASLHWSTVETNLSLKSVERLEKIASDDEYCSAVRRMKVCRSHGSYFFGYGLPWKCDDKGLILMDCDAVKRVQRLLGRQFPNCTTLQLTDVHPGALDSPKYRIVRPLPRTLWCEDLVDLFFSSIALGSTPITKVLIDYRHNKITGPWLRSGVERLEQDYFATPWEHLEVLKLQGQIGTGSTAKVAVALISKGTGIKQLSITNRTRTSMDDSKLYPRLLSASHLPALTHLCLTFVGGLTEREMCGLLSRFKNTLQHLQLYEPMITGSWKPVCESLRLEFPVLKSLTMVDCVEKTSKFSSTEVTFFCPLRDKIADMDLKDLEFIERTYEGRRYCVNGVRYRGTRIGAVLQLLESSMYKWPPPFEVMEHRPTHQGRRPKTKFRLSHEDAYC